MRYLLPMPDGLRHYRQEDAKEREISCRNLQVAAKCPTFGPRSTVATSFWVPQTFLSPP